MKQFKQKRKQTKKQTQSNTLPNKMKQKCRKKNYTGTLGLGQLHRSGENHILVHISMGLDLIKLIFNAGMQLPIHQ